MMLLDTINNFFIALVNEYHDSEKLTNLIGNLKLRISLYKIYKNLQEQGCHCRCLAKDLTN